MTVKRNGEIDLLRLFFALGIVFFHFSTAFDKDFFANGYIGVEFFFIVAGYLMGRQVYYLTLRQGEIKNIGSQTWVFLFNKIRVFYKYYLCAILAYIIGREILTIHKSLDEVLLSVFRGIPSFLLLFMGLNYESMSLYVPGLWYLSAMVIALFVLYPWAVKNYDFAVRWMYPVIFFVLAAYLYHSYSTLSNWTRWSFITYNGVLRAIAEIAFGAFLFEVTRAFSLRFAGLLESGSVMVKTAFTIMKVICFIVVFIYARGSFGEYLFARELDLYIFFLCAAGIMLSFAGAGYCVPDCGLTRMASRLSLIIYVFHGVGRMIYTDLYREVHVTSQQYAMFIAVTLISCLILAAVTDAVSRLFKRA